MDLYSGTWSGRVETTVGIVPAGLADGSRGDPIPVAIAMNYRDGVVQVEGCVPTLYVDVYVTLQLGDEWIVRGGDTRLHGHQGSAGLAIILLPNGDGSDEEVTLSLNLDSRGSATGTVSIGSWSGTVFLGRS